MAETHPPPEEPSIKTEPGIHVELTHSHLSPLTMMNFVRSPKAGAIVMFAGTTRDNFDNKAVKQLAYSAYIPLALRSLLRICREVKVKHQLQGIALVHRLGVVPVGEESVLVVVSAAHREAAWRAGEEALEECKEKVEIWKLEEFEEGEGIWRANRDGAKGVRVDAEAGGL